MSRKEQHVCRLVCTDRGRHPERVIDVLQLSPPDEFFDGDRVLLRTSLGPDDGLAFFADGDNIRVRYKWKCSCGRAFELRQEKVQQLFDAGESPVDLSKVG